MKRTLYIFILFASLLIASSCEDSLGIDDYTKQILKGDTLAEHDARKVTTFDTIEVDKIVVRDSIIYKDSVIVTYDTIYVRVDTNYTDLRLDFGISEFWELYNPNVQKENYRWFPDSSTHKSYFEVTFQNNMPNLQIDLELHASRADFRGNQSERTEIVQSVILKATIDNFPGYNNKPLKLNGDMGSKKYSSIRLVGKDGKVVEYSGHSSPMEVVIYRNSILTNEIFLYMIAPLPRIDYDGEFLFEGYILLRKR